MHGLACKAVGKAYDLRTSQPKYYSDHVNIVDKLAWNAKVAIKNNEPNETPLHVDANIEVDAADGIDPFKVGMCSTTGSHDPLHTMRCDN